MSNNHNWTHTREITRRSISTSPTCLSKWMVWRWKDSNPGPGSYRNCWLRGYRGVFNITRLCFAGNKPRKSHVKYSWLTFMFVSFGKNCSFSGKRLSITGMSSLFDINMRFTVPETAWNDTKKVNLKDIENEINFRSMDKTRDKLSFFIVKPYSSFISSLFLWPVPGSQIVGKSQK